MEMQEKNVLNNWNNKIEFVKEEYNIIMLSARNITQM